LTIRINRRAAADGIVVELHGWLSHEVLAEFTSVCDSVGDPLRMDLSQLAGTDEAGLAAVQSRIASGAQLEGASPYIRLLLESAPVPARIHKSKGDDSR
jgi:hypothetical protein